MYQDSERLYIKDYKRYVKDFNNLFFFCKIGSIFQIIQLESNPTIIVYYLEYYFIKIGERIFIILS